MVIATVILVMLLHIVILLVRGSIDSGPVSDPSNYFLVVAMYIIFLGLLPLIVLAAAAIYYFRSHLKTWWSKKAHKAHIKSRTKTTTQRKAQPPPKFSFNRNTLRSLEISEPIQIPPPISSNSVLSSVTNKANKNAFDMSSQSQVQISPPIPQNSVSGQLNKFVPSRPAPPRPISAPKRELSWIPSMAGVTTVTPISNLRNPSKNSGGSRPVSTVAFRPNCPPPRPPPPKSNSQSQPQQNISCSYEDFATSSENERSPTPNSSFYDDCQTLDFSDTSLSFVHKHLQNSEKENTNCDGLHHKSSNSNMPEKANTLHQVANRSKSSISKILPQELRTNENSVVASLAQKFEKQGNLTPIHSSKASLRPPFKSRPLPPTPDNLQV
ncbi:disintegrin and metalloproteinase domain-containing protein 12 [Trichonephila clavipes]|uniref:Disintegrin and metalloproteinase domain-containing protein 12 n=1 Tax=Trichonephila clavipes TaxID=2585209 RepID=A0A8X6T436_TRICX|nr:disintegrin and metalloproteinase domain-containing protein 12 [Trichonephila clavipes]